MKFYVDEMPKAKEECIFSERSYNPPFIEEPYFIHCKIDRKRCDLSDLRCRYLIEAEKGV